MAVFDRGDIVRVRLDPVEGHEMRGDARPALVLTTRDFNRLGDVLVAPITQGGDFSRFAGFAVSLSGAGCKTQGVALVNKMRMMDLATRKAKKVTPRVARFATSSACERPMTVSKLASRHTLESDLSRVDAHRIKPAEYRDLPELSDEMLARAVVKKGGRPRAVNPRQLISLRLPAEVVARWRATGPGWQTRMAERLSKVVVGSRAKSET